MERWIVTDRWWTDRMIVRAYCACGWSTPNMVTRKRAETELEFHEGKCSGKEASA